MIDAIAMNEVIPFRLQETADTPAINLARFSLSALGNSRSGTPALGFLGYRADLAAVFGASFLPDTFHHIAGMVVPRSSLIISDEPAEL
jgi:hypothetical protein